MLIDFHNHLGVSPDGGKSNLHDILANMKIYGMSKLVLFAIDEQEAGATFEKVNTRVLEAQNTYPSQIIAFARIIPSAGQIAIDEFKRCCEAGVKGLKMKAKDGFSPMEAVPILNLIGNKPDFPVVVHTSSKPASSPGEWEPILKEYEHINFVLAHGGKNHYRACAEIASKYPNVYVDTTTLSFHRSRCIYQTVGSEKIVFASDYPYSHPAIELKKYEVIVPDKNDLKNIHYKNAQKLLGLSHS